MLEYQSEKAFSLLSDRFPFFERKFAVVQNFQTVIPIHGGICDANTLSVNLPAQGYLKTKLVIRKPLNVAHEPRSNSKF
jgi:hypothetical protein